jgi:hypothetical protein
MTPFTSLAAVILALQTGTPSYPSASAPSQSATTAVAQRAARPPVIDGKDDDDVWQAAASIGEFRQFRPKEDTIPSLRTEAKVAYDAHNFYVFVRAFDSSPDSINKLLARRDIRVCCDQIKIIIDSYHDRRSGFEFAVNPGGVKRDYAVYDDGAEDDAWDGVWEVGTLVDSLGWTAEFRIPLSQLRYAHRPSNTFGFGVWRDIDRRGQERVSWPLYRVSKAGFISQLGEITGLEGLAAPTRLEVTPYVVTKNVPRPAFERDQEITGGLDVKYGLTSNITVDATVNPDFGQIEADPAVVNLSVFETFFQERRPFFIEGTGTFQFDVNCNIVNCSGENLFYSRRIGREPQLLGAYGDAESPAASRILGAAKITGRLPGGLTIGALEAVTQRHSGPGNRTIEPLTNYAALRARQDFRKGESGIGVMLTGVHRDVDEWTDPFLRRSAFAGAIDARHRFANGRYQVRGSLGLTRVNGSPTAIARTQRSSVRYYQRPDDNIDLDTTRTSLSGSSQELVFRKFGGFIQFETSYMRRSPGFEINDLGILFRADQQGWNTWGSLNWQNPTRLIQQGFWNFNWWQFWTSGGLPTERAANTNAHMQLKNRWWVHYGATLGGFGDVFCDRCARGGPALRRDRVFAPWGGIEGDQRWPVAPYLFVNYTRNDGGRSEYFNVNGGVELRISSRFRGSVTPSVTHRINNSQDFGAHQADTNDVEHYVFARLDQQEASVRFRIDYTATTTLTLQAYAEPFVSKGRFSDVRELSATPRAARYADRFQAYSAFVPPDFNRKFFNSNVVLRWEYRPGSTLFLVWNQGRSDSESSMGTRNFGRDFGRLFDAYPSNTFLIKASYWLTPLSR